MYRPVAASIKVSQIPLYEEARIISFKAKYNNYM